MDNPSRCLKSRSVHSAHILHIPTSTQINGNSLFLNMSESGPSDGNCLNTVNNRYEFVHPSACYHWLAAASRFVYRQEYLWASNTFAHTICASTYLAESRQCNDRQTTCTTFPGERFGRCTAEEAAAATTANCLPCLCRIKALANSPHASFIDVAQMISGRRLAPWRGPALCIPFRQPTCEKQATIALAPSIESS